MKKLLAMLLSVLLVLSLLPVAFAEEEADTRPRTIVTTDLEVDDMDSLMHLLLYANDIDIAGNVVSASQHHWTGRWRAYHERSHRQLQAEWRPHRVAPDGSQLGL